ncbi:MAG: YraN family protein [Bacteroidetes bacterium]|nr:MAG: YraN family protein [Bacteroidota bacterium]
MATHNDLGKQGEDLACQFMEAKGYHILDRNYRFERAEIDIAALRLDPPELVFIEVKTRSSEEWGYPEASVTPAKQALIFKAADSYLYEKQMDTVPVRFDIIAINMQNPEHPLIHHIEDAFRMVG